MRRRRCRVKLLRDDADVFFKKKGLLLRDEGRGNQLTHARSTYSGIWHGGWGGLLFRNAYVLYTTSQVANSIGQQNIVKAQRASLPFFFLPSFFLPMHTALCRWLKYMLQFVNIVNCCRLIQFGDTLVYISPTSLCQPCIPPSVSITAAAAASYRHIAPSFHARFRGMNLTLTPKQHAPTGGQDKRKKKKREREREREGEKEGERG
jgi:hypothetical protein